MARTTISKRDVKKLSRWFYGIIKSNALRTCIEFHHVGRVSSYVKLRRNDVLIKNLKKLRYFGGFDNNVDVLSIMGLTVVACSKDGKGYYFTKEVEDKLGIPLYY